MRRIVPLRPGLGKSLGRSGPAYDPWLLRQNQALKLRGLAVTLELVGA
jgi:hypothetical protein